MKRPPKQKRNLQGDSAKRTKFSRKDLLQVWGVIALIFGIIGSGVAYHIAQHKASFAKSLTSTVEDWRKTYHLDDAQARRILEIEFAFHGTGNPLTKPNHTPAEISVHHAEMAAVLNPSDRERFLKDQEAQ